MSSGTKKKRKGSSIDHLPYPSEIGDLAEKIGLSWAETLSMYEIRSGMNSKNLFYWRSQAGMAKRMGCSPDTVQRAITLLKTKGLLKVERTTTRKGKGNKYSFNYSNGKWELDRSQQPTSGELDRSQPSRVTAHSAIGQELDRSQPSPLNRSQPSKYIKGNKSKKKNKLKSSSRQKTDDDREFDSSEKREKRQQEKNKIDFDTHSTLRELQENRKPGNKEDLLLTKIEEKGQRFAYQICLEAEKRMEFVNDIREPYFYRLAIFEDVFENPAKYKGFYKGIAWIEAQLDRNCAPADTEELSPVRPKRERQIRKFPVNRSEFDAEMAELN